MQSVPMLFNDRPLFSEMVAKAREELHCLGDDGIAVDGVMHLGCPLWGIYPRVPQDGTWAAPSEVARPVRSRRAHQDYKLY